MSTRDELKELRKTLAGRHKNAKAEASGTTREPTLPGVAAADLLNATIKLSAADLELVEEQAGLKAKEPPPPPRKEAPPVAATDPAVPWREDAAFFDREASALAAQHPERAGLMWLHAAKATLLAGSELPGILAHVDRALERAPSSPQLLPLLRRLLHLLGQYDRVLELTERQTQVGGDAADRIAALIEAAAIVRHLRADPRAAQALLHRALDLHPGHAVALTLTATMQLELGQDEAAAMALEQLADAVSSSEGRAACLYAAGTVRELRLGQVGHAEVDYGRAIEYDPEHLPALVALSDLHDAAGAWHHLCQDLERIAALESDPALRARQLLRVGLLHLYRTKDLDAAARAFAGAADAAPEDTVPLTRLVEVYELTGRRESQVEALRRLLALTIDAPGQAALLVRIGWLLRHWPNRQEEVVAAYRQALAVQPGYLPAVQALGTIYRQRGDYDGLVSILQSEAEGTDAVARRAHCLLEIGEILAERLQRPSDAIEAYQRVLELAPDLRLAFWRLRALLYHEQRHVELARLLAAQIEATEDEGTRHYLLLELARLQAGPLHSSARGIATLEQARKLSGARVTELELLELYGQAGQFAEMAQLLLDLAGSTQDAAEAKWRRIYAAMTIEDSLAEHDRALALYWSVLDQDPHCVSAIRGAGRILHRLGRWNELVGLHHRELESVSDATRRAEIWCRVGRVFEADLGHPAEAVTAYQKALELEPGFAMALDALERLLSYEQRPAELVSVLEHYATRRKEPFAAADLLCRAAEVTDALLDQPARATALYERALERNAASEVALFGLLRLQLRGGAHAEAAQTLERLLHGARGATDRGRLLLQLARLKEYRLDGRPDAAYYDAAAAQAPAFRSRLLLEQIRCRRHDPGAPLEAALLDLGALLPDAELCATALLECAQRSELRAPSPDDDPAAIHAQQIIAATQALAHRPEDLAARWCLQRALLAASDWGPLAEQYETEAGLRTDPTMSLHLLAEAALTRLCGGDAAGAATLARRCLTIDPHHLPAVRWLVRLVAQESSELATLQDQLAEACADGENRLRACLQAADLWEHVGDATRALDSLQRLLIKDPTQPEVFQRAERLLETKGDFTALSQLYGQRIAACADPEQRVELLRRHVRLLRDRLADPARAIAELQRLREASPGDVHALAELAELLRSAQRWTDATGALAELAARTSDDAQRHQARLAQARVLLHELHQPEQALQVLQQVVAEEPGNLEAKQIQVELYVAECQWDDAQRLLDEVAAEDQPSVQVWALCQAAEVARVGRRDDALRERYEREAIGLAAATGAVLEALVDRYRRRRELARLTLVGATALNDLSDADAASRLRLTLARLLLEELKQPARALEYLRECRVVEPESATIDLLYYKALEYDGAVEEATLGYRRILERDPRSVEACRGLSRLMGVLGKPALGAAAVALLDFFGAATSGERTQAAELELRGGSPPGRFEPRDLPLDPELEPLAEVLNLALPHLGSVFPFELRQPLGESHPVVVAATQIAVALGLSSVRVAIEGDEPARAGVGDPPPLQISARLAARRQDATFYFWVGRALVTAATAGALLARLSDSELGELVEALAVERPIAPVVQRLRKQIVSALPRKVRKLIDQRKPTQVKSKVWARYREAEELRADRIAMVICGSPKVALSELVRLDGSNEARIEQLLRFALSDAYAVCHSALWSLRLQAV